jgi:chemotaxis methyl-accepting protein methylase
MYKIKTFYIYSKTLEHYNAVICYNILEYFKWNTQSNLLACWLGMQIPFDSW